MSLIYELMLTFNPDKIVDYFVKQFLYEYGEKKLKEVIITVRESEKVLDHIRYLIIKNHAPTDISIGSVLNSTSYFLLSKPETLCLGGLIFIIMWKDILVDMYDGPFEEAYEEQTNNIATKICTNYVVRCSRMKFTKINTCFTRFFDDIKLSQNN